MCSGKTTLGQALADATSTTFIDLDHYIEQLKGKTISQIFADEGVDAFRQAEHEALKEIAAQENMIVACGGGTPCHHSNIDIINSRGTSIYLQCSYERLLERLKLGRHKRPLIASLSDAQLQEFIVSEIAKREPHYSKAQHTFDSTFLENDEEIRQTVCKFINRFMNPITL